MKLDIKDESINENTYAIRALQRGLQILDALLEAREPLNLEQICQRTGLIKSTAFRSVVNLIETGYLVQTSEGYWLGLKLLRFGRLVEEKLDLKKLALPHLAQLRDQVNETVHLAVLDDELRVVYLEKLAAQQSIGVMMSRVGITTPMYCTGLGKAMAAYRPAEQIHAWLHKNQLKRYTAHTITEEEALLEEFRQIRVRGYATDNSEHEAEVRCIAAPIRDHEGDVIAAISVAGPASRMPTPLVGSPLAARVVETAYRISASMGYTAEEIAVS
jgi:DNA-binding IclR family transcriptional regulator